MKRIRYIFISILLVIICPHIAKGQVVQKKKSTGEVFIDCSNLSWAVDYSLNMIGNVSTTYVTQCRVYKKLQIATDDCCSDGSKRTSSSSPSTMLWNVAVGLDEKYLKESATGHLQGQIKTGCANYYELNESEKGSWRTPTLRELQLVWVLLNNGSSTSQEYGGPLSKALDTSKFKKDASYWSSSEVGPTTAWFVNFKEGFSDNSEETITQIYLRCVREVK